jgi:hypothetical protein
VDSGRVDEWMERHRHLPWEVNQLSVTVAKYQKQSTYKEERFILAHSFRGFSPWLIGPTAWRPLGGVAWHGRSRQLRKAVCLTVVK